MPGQRKTKVNAFRQLVEAEKHDDSRHFPDALGARKKLSLFRDDRATDQPAEPGSDTVARST